MSSSLFPLNMLPQIISIHPRARLSSTYAPPLRTATAYLQTTQGRRKREKGRREGQGGQQSDTRPSFPSSLVLLPSSLSSDFEAVFLGELLDAAFGIDELPLPRKERMAARANLDTNVLFRGTGHKGRATGATDDRGLVVLGMNALLHLDASSLSATGTRERGAREGVPASILCHRTVLARNQPRLYHMAQDEETRRGQATCERLAVVRS